MDPATNLAPRMRNPAEVIPDAAQPIQALYAAALKSGVPTKTIALIHLRISQINGCGPCVDGGAKHAKKDGESDERLSALAVWREAPYYSGSERAALELAEAVTRLSDRTDAVPDAVWNAATKHFDEVGMAGLLLAVAATNVFNRLNVPTRQIAGSQKW